MVRWCDLLTSVAEPNRSAFVFSSTIVRLRLLLLLGDASACMNSPVSPASRDAQISIAEMYSRDERALKGTHEVEKS
jgi:hypothetical protein